MIDPKMNSPELLKMIENNKSGILEQIKSEFMQPEKIRLINKKYCDDLWSQIDTAKDTFIILLPQDKLDAVSLEREFEDLKSEIVELLKCGYNKFTVNNEFIIKYKSTSTYTDTHEAFSDYKKLSYSNIVFFFGNKALDVFINGNTEHYNTFYCATDLQKYTEKYKIEELDKVLELYNNRYISKQSEYSRFFEAKANIDRLVNKNDYYILKNSPERFMRDNLRSYLNEHMQARFQVEIELPVSKNKLDLYTEVDGRFYFIEIKWLGKSINSKGTDISCSYTDSRARNGIIQTLEYIRELKVNTDNNVKCGMLVVFDARKKKKKIDYKDYSFLSDKLNEYITYLRVFDKIHLSNLHPC